MVDLGVDGMWIGGGLDVDLYGDGLGIGGGF